ncbi:MAG TPA: Rrf2 family transcriptional regulator [Phycisphaerae bacterium]|nr:Rrf2 family transcriptional regulator [Phycisphaerae bacterium]
MVSRTVEYALRAIVWLASQDGSPRTTRQMAHATQVPAGYLAKVMQTLVDAGLVSSQRGLGGGFVLARDPRSISVLDVVAAVEPIPRIRACPLKLSAHQLHLCPLHRRIDDALAMVEKAFAESTIAELLAEGNKDAPLCPNPDAPTPRAQLTAPKRAGKPKARPGGRPDPQIR